MNKDVEKELSRIQLLSAKYNNKSRMCPLEIKKEEIRCHLIYEYIKELRQERDKLKEVIEEVREYVENNMYYTLADGNTDDYVIEDAQNELLQILDKVKG